MSRLAVIIILWLATVALLFGSAQVAAGLPAAPRPAASQNCMTFHHDNGTTTHHCTGSDE